MALDRCQRRTQFVADRAEQRDERIIVSIADDGPGIAPDELPHVFERFYRARHGRQQHSGGTGLGLAICKAFIEAHRGHIWVESDTPGTTISFSLPLAFPIAEKEEAEIMVATAIKAQSATVQEWGD
ncbi:MAG: hypothetical protein NVS2B12_37850 [Ktedonobacteraceae bacterium]